MKLLTYTTLYPNSVRPAHGVFVENRLRHLLAIAGGGIQARVLAPVPWFPLQSPMFGAYASFARIPATESRHGIIVEHPRYPLVPKLGMSVAPFLMAAATIVPLRKLARKGYQFDIIDAHYFYPDGVAAAILGWIFQKPVVITGRGTDLNLISRYRIPRLLIRWAAARSSGLVTVCQALKEVLVQLGVHGDKVNVLRNGVDLTLFTPPKDRSALRETLGIKSRTLLSVGGLIQIKGHNLVIRALTRLPGTDLIIIGDGPDRESLTRLSRTLGVEGRVKFLGAMRHEQLPDYFGAADALVLCSSREGWPNVLLEAMACGTPVVATRIGGIPEVVAAPEAGVLTKERTLDAIAAGVQKLFSHYPDRRATRRYAEQFSWDATAAGLGILFGRILAQDTTDPAETTLTA